MVNEYIFFAADLRDRFVAFAAAQGVAGTWRTDGMEGFVVALPDDLADAVEDAIEDEYDRLMDQQRERIEAEEGSAGRDLMGVAVTLPDGRPCTVRLPAAVARRLFEHFDAAEIQALVDAIAQSVANPMDGPICRGA